ncbi:hypothetical protein L3X38_021237 [Prunus dulcis]|uniref:Uncharacterized protein n=1 Tax=Prunus dulcis TaxID=3755 RepID=A0AAD4VW60_PRUDU|nr:hypothetical protein L3X38_021237 [Prunus dulcis]
MLQAEDSSNWNQLPAAYGFAGVDLDDEGMSMDVDTLLGLIAEESPSRPQNYSLENQLQAEEVSDAQLQSGFQALKEEPPIETDLMGPGSWHTPYSLEASDSGAGGPDGSFESAGNRAMSFDYKEMEPSAHTGSPGHAYSTSLKDWNSLFPGNEAGFVVSQPTCSTASSFAEGHANHILYHGDPNVLQGKADVAGKVDSEYASQCLGIENMDLSYRTYGNLGENTRETQGPSENNSCTSMETTLCQNSDVFSDHYPALCGMSLDNTFLADTLMHHSPTSYYFPSNEEMMANVKDESGEFPTDSSCSSSKMNLNGQEGITGKSAFQPSMIDVLDVKEWNFGYDNCLPAISGNSSFDADSFPADNKSSIEPLRSTQTYISSKMEPIGVKDEMIDELVAPSSVMCHPYRAMDEAVSRQSSFSADDHFFDKDSKLSGFGISTQNLGNPVDHKEDMIVSYKGACHFQDNMNGSSTSPIDGPSMNSNALERYLPVAQPFTSSKNQAYVKDEHEDKVTHSKSMHLSKVSPESIHSNFSDKSPVEDDFDVRIIENISHPAPSNRSPVVINTSYHAPLNHFPALGNTLVNSQQLAPSDHYTEVGGMRCKARDEQLILRVALQDLSQPKSEAIPPDGLLAVPLLRHQRIALSWMVQKETASLHCSGGILADDQGLGKTISTIALILKERPPSYGACQDVKKRELETLDLDNDDDMPSEIVGRKQHADAREVIPNGIQKKSMKPMVQAKGRPAAGTLVVCPTSVLRQWAEELHNKVTGKANISVLVYHGSNRTKDPCELAKFDVVLTTYSIVSMEVPKQPLVDEDDEEKVKPEENDIPHVGFSSSKKRKYPQGSANKCSKGKKGVESAMLESVARPLAKVGWFRVVLDEAQSIKNHRTQVARACWGLRAKRRWCLSGTPIQNAIDDLYSYFRFLKYDPYAVYKSFCSTIKVPISKNPAKGYRKLQAVLKTIMLRRTKGTLLDGEPIITLPPKFIELKRVEFSKEERDFYSRLEADSRAQFEEYAAAGTVKQNYVNILLMLLRLRQACDHPLLVRRYDSHSLWRSSVENAKKLPRDKQLSLMNCLEASLAICGLCNDPPEDAVVSECGHVFCSQCISEHLTGDDNQCPNTNCKVRLNVSSVFSKATLNSSLSDQPNPDSIGSEVFDAVESFYEDHSYNSSKIKAALEVLCAMCKPQACISGNSCLDDRVERNAGCPENSSDIRVVEPLEDVPNRQNLDVETCSKNSNKVVREKAIVFSQWTRMLDLLEACLKTSSIEYRRLDGTMSVVARDKAVKDFNTLPEVSVMIMSLKAASLGLNMVAACHVLLLDLWWNPTTEDQAIDRAHRIGQTRPVTVLRLTVRDTVEDRILALQQKKREMVASAFGEDETGGRQTRLTVEDLKYLFMM